MVSIFGMAPSPNNLSPDNFPLELLVVRLSFVCARQSACGEIQHLIARGGLGMIAGGELGQQFDVLPLQSARGGGVAVCVVCHAIHHIQQ